MPLATESITLTFPRSAIGDVLSLSAALLERMHELLERNREGNLASQEQHELETLVLMAEFGQLISTAMTAQAKP